MGNCKVIRSTVCSFLFTSYKKLTSSFDDKDEVVSLISRSSIDTLSTLPFPLRSNKADSIENVFRDQVTMDEWKMIRAMKDEQGIQ
jgi:hypothetical protein